MIVGDVYGVTIIDRSFRIARPVLIYSRKVICGINGGGGLISIDQCDLAVDIKRSKSYRFVCITDVFENNTIVYDVLQPLVDANEATRLNII